MPPHDPYHTRTEFYRQFSDDDYRLPKKPDHFFSKIKPYQELSQLATWYDEYIMIVVIQSRVEQSQP